MASNNLHPDQTICSQVAWTAFVHVQFHRIAFVTVVHLISFCMCILCMHG